METTAEDIKYLKNFRERRTEAAEAVIFAFYSPLRILFYPGEIVKSWKMFLSISFASDRIHKPM